jgi:hypothetical protein
MTRLTALLLLLCASFGAHAYSGKELLVDCQAAEAIYIDKKAGDPYQSLQSARCLAYVSGFADGYIVSDFLARKVDVQLNAFCLPNEKDDLQYRLVRAVVAHLEKQPPNADAPSRTLVAGALSKAFPCGQ